MSAAVTANADEAGPRADPVTKYCTLPALDQEKRT